MTSKEPDMSAGEESEMSEAFEPNMLAEAEAHQRATEERMERDLRDIELLAKVRAPGKPLDALLELLDAKRVDCEAEVKYCESRCEDDVVAVARRCLELVVQVTQLLRGDTGQGGE